MTTNTTYANTITAAAQTQAVTASAAVAAAPANTLAQLAGNFNDFLSLLTTQLKNQDPTSPMDTNEFTSQLVQFTSVQEQINTNATLGQLLTATQGQQLTQATGLVGQTAEFTASSLPLQNGTGEVKFQSTGAQPVQITVTNANGAVIRSDIVNASNGSNTWSWNGTDASGNQEPDGSYSVSVTTVSSSGAGTALPFTVVGTVTGAEQNNNAVQLMFGDEGVTFDKVVSFGGAMS